mmetsp:Transcript_11746/g.22330  ORF Transcript_11746/g.22330 Transcript_11746/m.22330 type:complete len:293 (+) Transcript_11746:1119-1997(+)
MLAHDDARGVLAHDANLLRLDDFVRGLVLQHAVLVDAALMREGVCAHDGLVWLHRHARVLRHHAAGEGDVLDVQPRAQPAHKVGSAQLQRQRHLLQGRVSCALADAVDGALELTGAVDRAREGVAGGQAQVVLAVRGDDDVLRAGRIGLDLGNQLPKLGGNGDAHRVWDVEGGGARLDHLPQDAVEKLGVGAARVLRRKLHILATQASAVLDGVHGELHHLVRGLVELELHVDGAGGDEGVDARPTRVPHRLPRRVDIALVGARQAADDRHVPVARLVHVVPHRLGDVPHRL